MILFYFNFSPRLIDRVFGGFLKKSFAVRAKEIKNAGYGFELNNLWQEPV